MKKSQTCFKHGNGFQLKENEEVIRGPFRREEKMKAGEGKDGKESLWRSENLFSGSLLFSPSNFQPVVMEFVDEYMNMVYDEVLHFFGLKLTWKSMQNFAPELLFAW